MIDPGAWLYGAQPAQAIRDVQLPDGSTVTAYELDIALKVVALRGSVPSDAILEFRHALSKYGRFQLAQKPQIEDIFEELNQPRSFGFRSHPQDIYPTRTCANHTQLCAE